MIRETKQQKVCTPPWLAMALIATVAGCSSAAGPTRGGISGDGHEHRQHHANDRGHERQLRVERVAGRGRHSGEFACRHGRTHRNNRAHRDNRADRNNRTERNGRARHGQQHLHLDSRRRPGPAGPGRRHPVRDAAGAYTRAARPGDLPELLRDGPEAISRSAGSSRGCPRAAATTSSSTRAARRPAGGALHPRRHASGSTRARPPGRSSATNMPANVGLRHAREHAAHHQHALHQPGHRRRSCRRSRSTSSSPRT